MRFSVDIAGPTVSVGAVIVVPLVAGILALLWRRRS